MRSPLLSGCRPLTGIRLTLTTPPAVGLTKKFLPSRRTIACWGSTDWSPNSPYMMANAMATRLIRKMDTKGNGKISREDMLRFFEKTARGKDYLDAADLREALRSHGWRWLLYLVAAMIVFGLLSMGLDRLRRLQKDRLAATMPPGDEPPTNR